MSEAKQVIKLWDRFHVRLTALYGVAVFGVLAPMTYAYYSTGVDREVEALRQRMATSVTAVAVAVPGDQIGALVANRDRSKPLYKALVSRFSKVCKQDPEIKNIYVLLRTNEPKKLKFAIDFIADGTNKQAAIGEDYDASDWPYMLRGLERVSVEKEVTSDDWGPSISGYAPIFDGQGRSVGLVGMDVKGARVEEHKRSVLWTSVVIALLALCTLSLAAVAVGRNIREPLSKIITATESIAGGELETRLRLGRKDEFGLVGSHFDSMAAGLQEREQIRGTFGRFVSEEVATALLAGDRAAALGGEVREVTILFTDLQGYSTISEKLQPTEVVDLLNRYLGGMNDVIDRHNGVVIEFLGDAILAVFGAPNDLDNHAEAALQCALEMQTTLEQLNEQWRRDGVSERWEQVGISALRHRVGIHTGPVVAGNLGSSKRAKYAVIGDTVNVAARLEQLNKSFGTSLLCSDTVHHHVNDALQARLKRVGELEIKGREGQVGAWTVA